MPNVETQAETETQFDQLEPGDRIRVDHEVKVGPKRWNTTTSGTVVRAERSRHGLHFQRNTDDKAFSDTILIELTDGELTALTVDEYTTIHRA